MSSLAPFEVVLAGEPFRLRLPAGSLRAALESAWRPFLARVPAGEGVEVVVELRNGALPPGERTMPVLERLANGSSRVSAPGLSAVVAPDLSAAEITQGPGRYPVETLLKLLLAERLRARGGLLVHGVGLASAGRAAVFSGPSGAGKSTLASCGHAGGLEPLSDELVAIVEEDGASFALGTPWNVGAPRRNRLAMLGVLAHAPSSTLEKVSKSEVLRTLVGNTLLPRDEPDCRNEIFAALVRHLGRVESVRLAFAPNPDVGEVLSNALRE